MDEEGYAASEAEAGPDLPANAAEGGLVVPPGQESGTCPTCGGALSETAEGPAEPTYVYVLGRIQPRTPSLSVEKELLQATGRADTAGLTDRQTMHRLLSERSNRYLARQLCWVLTIEGLDTYLLQPRDPADLDLLIEAIRPEPGPGDLDVVIGVRGPLASPEMCSGLVVPIIGVDQIYSFDTEALIKAIPRPDQLPAKQFNAAARETLARIMQIADNAGATDEHRALNYLAVRYDAIYHLAAERHRESYSLSGVEVRPSRLSGVRQVVDVVFSYTSRQTGVTEDHFVRVDVTDEWPFVLTPLSPYYDRL